MEKKEQIQEELERLSPLLASLKQAGQEAAGGVPPGYFEALPDEVLARARAAGTAARPFLRLAWRRRLAYAAAVLLGALGGFWYWQSQPAADGPLAALEGVASENLQGYIDEHIEAFDLELILEALAIEPGDLRKIEILPDIKGSYLDQYLDEAIDELSWSDLEELL